MKSRNAGLAQIVVSVLKYVDYYSNEEIEQLSGVLGTLDSRNVYERLKARADTLLENKCYYGAVQNYAKIIEGTYDKSLSGLFYARVYHNMGVAHARMFLYKQSVPYFEEAYKIGQHEESLKCLMAAKRLAMGNNIIESDDASDQEAADKVAALIDAIYVQERNDNTDEQCKEAKEAWDALTDAQKELVEGENADPDYFGRDTGDASKDDP